MDCIAEQSFKESPTVDRKFMICSAVTQQRLGAVGASILSLVIFFNCILSCYDTSVLTSMQESTQSCIIDSDYAYLSNCPAMTVVKDHLVKYCQSKNDTKDFNVHVRISPRGMLIIHFA